MFVCVYKSVFCVVLIRLNQDFKFFPWGEEKEVHL
mgnify:CR=1 FL=1